MKVCIIICLLLFMPAALQAALLQDPTKRPIAMTQNSDLLHKRYPVDTVIIKKHHKVMQINNKRYTEGDYIDDYVLVVSIQPHKIILKDGRHGYANLYLKKQRG